MKDNQMDKGLLYGILVFLVELNLIYSECSVWKRYARYNNLTSTEQHEANAIFSENKCVKDSTVSGYVKHNSYRNYYRNIPNEI